MQLRGPPFGPEGVGDTKVCGNLGMVHGDGKTAGADAEAEWILVRDPTAECSELTYPSDTLLNR